MERDLWGAVGLTKAVLPRMVDKQEGHVVYVAGEESMVAPLAVRCSNIFFDDSMTHLDPIYFEQILILRLSSSRAQLLARSFSTLSSCHYFLGLVTSHAPRRGTSISRGMVGLGTGPLHVGSTAVLAVTSAGKRAVTIASTFLFPHAHLAAHISIGAPLIAPQGRPNRVKNAPPAGCLRQAFAVDRR